MLNEREICGHVWHDAWGDHKCDRNRGHIGRHRCHCDADTAASS